MKPKRMAILVLGVLAAMVGVEIERVDSTEVVGEVDLRPLRIELSLAERARASVAPADGVATESTLNLRLDLALSKEPATGAAVERTAAADAAALPVGGPVKLELLARQRDLGTPGESGDAFGAKSWVVAPPPPPPPPPPRYRAAQGASLALPLHGAGRRRQRPANLLPYARHGNDFRQRGREHR